MGELKGCLFLRIMSGNKFFPPEWARQVRCYKLAHFTFFFNWDSESVIYIKAWTPHPNHSMRECAKASVWSTCSHGTSKLKLTIWTTVLKLSAGEKGTVFNDAAQVSIISPPLCCLSHSYTPSSHPHLSHLLSVILLFPLSNFSSYSPFRQCPS